VLIQVEAREPRVEEREDGTRLLACKIVGRKKGDKERHYTLATFPEDEIEAVVKSNAKR